MLLFACRGLTFKMLINQMLDWDERYVIEKSLVVTGTAAWSHNVHATAIADVGDGTVTVKTETTHGYAVGSQVYIDGTDNYDGLHTITAVTTTTFTFTATYVAETPAGSGAETVRVVLAPVTGTSRDAFQLVELRLHLTVAPTTSESYTITLDSGSGSAFDVVVRNRNMITRTDDDWQPSAVLRYTDGDVLVFTYANSDGRTYGLEVKYRQLT